jgi:hypothetical protein
MGTDLELQHTIKLPMLHNVTAEPAPRVAAGLRDRRRSHFDTHIVRVNSILNYNCNSIFYLNKLVCNKIGFF